MKRLTQKYLKQILRYNKRSGVFYWRKHDRNHTRGPVGSLNSGNGYWRIGIDGKHYGAHRLAWLYVYGYWPKQIDHKNRIKTDNRIANLREANNRQNQYNAHKNNGASGYRGVEKYFHKWRARLKRKGKLLHLGMFHTPQAAHAAYCRAAKKLHGEYYRD